MYLRDEVNFRVENISRDYYPFGSNMPGRSFSTPSYRFGFNGKEKDDEGMGGGGATYDYGFRIYNPALGKFLSVDPLSPDYSELTPYQYASNTPIFAIDIDGLEGGAYRANPPRPLQYNNYNFETINRIQSLGMKNGTRYLQPYRPPARALPWEANTTVLPKHETLDGYTPGTGFGMVMKNFGNFIDDFIANKDKYNFSYTKTSTGYAKVVTKTQYNIVFEDKSVQKLFSDAISSYNKAWNEEMKIEMSNIEAPNPNDYDLNSAEGFKKWNLANKTYDIQKSVAAYNVSKRLGDSPFKKVLDAIKNDAVDNPDKYTITETTKTLPSIIQD